MSLPARPGIGVPVRIGRRRTLPATSIAGSTGVGVTLSGLMLIALVGLTVGWGHHVLASGLVIVSAAVALGLWRWRWSTYGLLLYLPVSGIPVLASYPDTSAAVLAKDVLFVMPAYAGFLVQHLAQRRRIAFSGAPIALLIGLVLLVIVHVFNPSLPNKLVGAIGAKVWLSYIPLLFLGYHLVKGRAEVGWLLGLMSITAILPMLIGCIEAILISLGHAQLVYGWYGPAAASATQEFTEFSLPGGGSLRRIPSTFSFFYQYFGYLLSMAAVSYAWWRAFLVKTRLAPLGVLVWLLTMLASFLSGARASFIFIPLLLATALLLEGPGLRLPVGRLVTAAFVFGTAAMILGGRTDNVLAFGASVGTESFQGVFITALRSAFALTAAGLGTGMDTNATRYAVTQSDQFTALGGLWYESWYVKVLLELGLAGLVIVATLFIRLIWAALRRHAGLEDHGLRVVSASFIAFLLSVMVLSTKAQYLDLDPVNVYFWLFAGILLRLATLDRTPSSADGIGETTAAECGHGAGRPRHGGLVRGSAAMHQSVEPGRREVSDAQ
jgi:hypothetical protein